MDVHDAPAAVFLVVDLRLAALCRDLVGAIFQRGVKGPSELRPRGVAIDVNFYWIRKQLTLGEESHCALIKVSQDSVETAFGSAWMDECNLVSS